MAKCINCGSESKLISKALQVCLECIRNDFGKVLPRIQKAHARSRVEFDLPAKPPKEKTEVENFRVGEKTKGT
jgi:predicted  nucleic acid-binding Zn-ribbon protein